MKREDTKDLKQTTRLNKKYNNKILLNLLSCLGCNTIFFPYIFSYHLLLISYYFLQYCFDHFYFVVGNISYPFLFIFYQISKNLILFFSSTIRYVISLLNSKVYTHVYKQ